MRYEHHEGGIPTIEMDPSDYEVPQEESPLECSALLEAAWRDMGGEG